MSTRKLRSDAGKKRKASPTERAKILKWFAGQIATERALILHDLEVINEYVPEPKMTAESVPDAPGDH